MLVLVIFSLILLLPTLDSTVINVSPSMGLRAAVNTSRAGDVVILDGGMFEGDGNCGVIIDKSITLRGQGSERTIVDCGNSVARRCFVLLNIGGDQIVSIEGIHFKNGKAPTLPTSTTTLKSENYKDHEYSQLHFSKEREKEKKPIEFSRESSRSLALSIAETTTTETIVGIMVMTSNGIRVVPPEQFNFDAVCKRKQQGMKSSGGEGEAATFDEEMEISGEGEKGKFEASYESSGEGRKLAAVDKSSGEDRKTAALDERMKISRIEGRRNAIVDKFLAVDRKAATLDTNMKSSGKGEEGKPGAIYESSEIDRKTAILDEKMKSSEGDRNSLDASSSKRRPPTPLDEFPSLNEFPSLDESPSLDNPPSHDETTPSLRATTITPTPPAALDDAGGCILVSGVTAPVQFIGIKVSQCRARRGMGMAVANSARITILNSEFSNNRFVALGPSIVPFTALPKGLHGGGLFITGTKSSWIANSTFSNNEIAVSYIPSYSTATPPILAVSGAGLYWEERTSSSELITEGTVFIGNSIQNVDGRLVNSLRGAGFHAYANPRCSITIRNSCVFKGNSIFSEDANLISGAGASLLLSGNTVAKIENSVSFENNLLSGTGFMLRGAGAYAELSGVGAQAFLRNEISFIGNYLTGGAREAYGGGFFLNDISLNGSLSIQDGFLAANNSMAMNTSAACGGGVYISGFNAISVELKNDIVIRNNLIKNKGQGMYSGGGLGFGSLWTLRLAMEDVKLIDNTIVSNAMVLGGGLFVDKAKSFSASNLEVTGNRIQQDVDMVHSLINLGYSELFGGCTKSETNTTENVLRATWGKLTDGTAIGEPYDAEIQCFTIIDPFSPAVSPWRYFASRVSGLALEVKLEMFDLEAPSRGCFDYLQLYDGNSTFAPSIGKYCGNLASYYCESGSCPPLDQAIYTSGPQLYVSFSSDLLTQGDGFVLTWKTVVAPIRPNITSFPFSVTGTNIEILPASSQGGGVYVGSSKMVDWQNIYVGQNSISHWLLALGGGVAFNKTTTAFFRENITIEDNSASSSYVAGGGGLSVGSYVSLTAQTCRHPIAVRRNSVNSIGACWSVLESSVPNCPSSVGGGVIVAGSYSSIVLNDIVEDGTGAQSSPALSVSENVASCSISSFLQKLQQPCYSLGGAIMVLGNTASLTSTTRNITSPSSSTAMDWTNDHLFPARSGHFFNNQAASGAGIGVSDSSNVDLTFSSCNDNLASCSLIGRGAGCLLSMGGCLYTDSGKVRFLKSNFERNMANEGGAVISTDRGAVELVSSRMIQNTATIVGGAAMVFRRGSITVDNSYFYLNIAGRASLLAGFNDDGMASYIFANNVSVIAPHGTLVLASGSWQGLEDSVNWQCAHKGTAMIQDSGSHNFYSLQCNLCKDGSYAVGDAMGVRDCRICPYGAYCGTPDVGVEGIQALGGFWGRVKGEGASESVVINENGQLRRADNHFDVGAVVMMPCPSGYCCPMGQNCTYNYCGGGRQGMLCGQCQAGSGLGYFTTGCIPADACHDGGWVIPLGILGAFIFVGWLVHVTKKGQESNGLIAVLLFFYQVTPLVRSSPWEYASGAFVGAMQAIFSLSPPDVDSGGQGTNSTSSSSVLLLTSSPSKASGICFLPEMQASQKLVIRMLFQAVVLGCIGIVCCVHWGLVTMIPKRFPRPKWRAKYIAVLIRFFTIAYTTMVLTPLQMLQCVDESYSSGERTMMSNGGGGGGERKIWFWDGNVECYAKWQIGAGVVIGILAPIPLLLIFVTKNRWLLKSHQHRRRSVFTRSLSASASSSSLVSSITSRRNQSVDGKGEEMMVAKSGSLGSSGSHSAVFIGRDAVFSIRVSEWRTTTDGLLVAGFRDERRWWLGVSLYRRLLLVLAYTMITDRVWLSMAMTSLCSIFVVIHLIFLPFKETSANHSETASLLIMTLLSATTAPQLAHGTFGSIRSVANGVALEYIQLVLVIIPVAVYGIYIFITIVLKKILRRLGLWSHFAPFLQKQQQQESELDDNNNKSSNNRSRIILEQESHHPPLPPFPPPPTVPCYDSQQQQQPICKICLAIEEEEYDEEAIQAMILEREGLGECLKHDFC